MKKFLLFPLAAMGVMMASCSSPSYTVTYLTSETNEARTLQTTSDKPIVQPLTVDLEIVANTKICDTIFLDSKTASSFSNYENIRTHCAYLTMARYDADVIVAPLYQITRNSNGTYTIIVSGYPARYKNWRNLNTSERAQVLPPVETPAPSTKKK